LEDYFEAEDSITREAMKTIDDLGLPSKFNNLIKNTKSFVLKEIVSKIILLDIDNFKQLSSILAWNKFTLLLSKGTQEGRSYPREFMEIMRTYIEGYPNNA